MLSIPVSEFIDRVVISKERIPFSFVDPFGHLSTCRYLELFMNHRVTAPDEQQGIVTMEIAKQGLGLLIVHASVDYLRPTYLGEDVEMISWVKSLEAVGFMVQGILYGQEKKNARATFRLRVCSVDLNRGRPIPFPETLPCRDPQLMAKLPLKPEVLKNITGVPAGF